jgi:hypothetical protein
MQKDKRPATHLPAFAKRLPLTFGVHQDILAASHNKKAIQRFLAWWTSQHDRPNQLIQLHLSDGATKCPCQPHNRNSATDSQAGWWEWRQPQHSSRRGRANDEL